jgi:hypothetical protein
MSLQVGRPTGTGVTPKAYEQKGKRTFYDPAANITVLIIGAYEFRV